MFSWRTIGFAAVLASLGFTMGCSDNENNCDLNPYACTGGNGGTGAGGGSTTSSSGGSGGTGGSLPAEPDYSYFCDLSLGENPVGLAPFDPDGVVPLSRFVGNYPANYFIYRIGEDPTIKCGPKDHTFYFTGGSNDVPLEDVEFTALDVKDVAGSWPANGTALDVVIQFMESKGASDDYFYAGTSMVRDPVDGFSHCQVACEAPADQGNKHVADNYFSASNGKPWGWKTMKDWGFDNSQFMAGRHEVLPPEFMSYGDKVPRLYIVATPENTYKVKGKIVVQGGHGPVLHVM